MLRQTNGRRPGTGWVCVVLALTAGMAGAATYTVSTEANGGAGSLRWAIKRANDHAGADRITFTPEMASRTIAITAPLPSITDGSVTIDGDLDDDGAPDIVVDGSATFNTPGLSVEANHCTIRGLAIVNWGFGAIELHQASGCRIYSCHLGVSKGGGAEQLCQGGAIYLDRSDGNRIGGTTYAERNVIAGQLGYGTVAFDQSNDNVFAGNYVGVTRSGRNVLRPGDNLTYSRYGVAISNSTGNIIGGTGPADRNVFAGLRMGISLNDHSTNNTILGNTFGLAADGNTVLGITVGVWVSLTSDNTIGGNTSECRNVFVSGTAEGMPAQGIWVAPNYVGASPDDCRDNRIRGNYFGLNLAGTAQRPLETGILIEQKTTGTTPPGPQIIGGNTSGHGNWFCCGFPGAGASPRGIWFYKGGDDSTVRNNKFGIFPVKSLAHPSAMVAGVRVENVGVHVLDNSLYGCGSGLHALYSEARLWAYRNTLNTCTIGVFFSDSGGGRLGNLSNAAVGDDGGNTFDPSNTWHVYNSTANPIRAEGNDFGTTSKWAINAKIWDRKDDPSLGRVDFDPLAGGVHPSGETLSPALCVTGAAAVPTVAGAEVSFTLSPAADVTVTVRNVAGRPVATLAAARPAEAGLQRLTWSRLSTHGTRVPAGRYLVTITAHAADGTRSTAVATVSLP